MDETLTLMVVSEAMTPTRDDGVSPPRQLWGGRLHLLALLMWILVGQEIWHGVEMKSAHSPLNEIFLFKASRLVIAAKQPVLTKVSCSDY